MSLYRPIDHDTIAAVATAPGYGGIGIVRLSGTKALDIAHALCGLTTLKPRQAVYTTFRAADESPIDSGLIIAFPGPQSFTGEDVVELQGHGGPVILQTLLTRCFDLGARQARPGEFSERAFLNDKLDLAQAEAIADLIHAQTETAAKQAQLTLRGDFSKAVHSFADGLLHLRTYVEAAIDFPEEEVDFLQDGQISQQLQKLLTQGQHLRDNARQGVIFRNGATVVMVGIPNAGKSSLLNNLAGEERAIVTAIPGTTRDLIKEHINIDGVPLHIIDTAGLRDSADVIEQEGIRRAESAMATADIVLYLQDDTVQPQSLAMTALPSKAITVLTKSDLSGRTPGALTLDDRPAVAISNKTGEGIDALKTMLLNALGVQKTSSSPYSARERHLHALNQSLDILSVADQQFNESGAGELLAEDLRLAHEALASITGKITSDALLGEIFSSFCIGK